MFTLAVDFLCGVSRTHPEDVRAIQANDILYFTDHTLWVGTCKVALHVHKPACVHVSACVCVRVCMCVCGGRGRGGRGCIVCVRVYMCA
jgi:hypothetical protein